MVGSVAAHHRLPRVPRMETNTVNESLFRCPSCGSPDPKIVGGRCTNAFHNPSRKASRRSSGKLSAYLIAHGWERSDAPAEMVGECGQSSDTVGYCEKPARWSRSNPTKLPMCAQHAAQAQRFDEALPAPRFPERCGV